MLALADRLGEQFQGECSLFRSLAERTLGGEMKIYEFQDDVEFSVKFHEEYHLVLLADEEGDVQTLVDSLDQDGPTAATRRARWPKNVRDHEWFEQLVDPEGSPAKGEVWFDRHLSPFMHRDTEKVSRDPADYSYGLAFPVPGEGRIVGAVLALKRWTGIQAELDARREDLVGEFPTARAFLFDADGSVLAHSDRTEYGSRYVAADELGEAPDVVVIEYERDGDTWHAGLELVPKVAGTHDWRCGIAAIDADLFRQSRDFAGVLLIVTLVVAGILVGWALFASRAILRPVRRLVLATERIAAGDFEARVPAQGRHELADLGRAFNEMAGEVARSRDRLRDAERQAAWAEMARQVAHEIKNPLTPMRMSAQLLLRANREKSERLPELVDRLARTVYEQTDALARIASDFRQFAGEVDREIVVTKVEDVLHDVELDFAATIESGVALRFEHGAGDARVEVDRQEIRQVFRNLVQNALEAAGADGEVVVSASSAGGRVRFSVSDTGPGIGDPAVRERLFEPYFTTRSSGTGLGLAICRRIVDAHGGTIELAGSEPGKTEFRFWLPSLQTD